MGLILDSIMGLMCFDERFNDGFDQIFNDVFDIRFNDG